ncbi:AsmA family protein [Acetobacter fabarum]|uniref:AsmA family protein n=1 Tax=Acetobacter fabarum TaxID=483199 RepID=UPI00312B2EF1
MTMRFKWKIGLLAGVVAVAAGGGTIFSATQDATWLKTRLSDAVEQSTGRHLSIGALHVWVLPFPWVEAQDVRLSGVEDGGPDVLVVKQVRARLSIMPLFSHRITFREVSVIAPKITVRRLSDGRADWLLTPPPAATEQGGLPASAVRMHWNVSASDLNIVQADVVWDDALTQYSGTFGLRKAMLRGLDGTAPDLDIQGQKGAASFSLTGQTGPFWPLGAQLPLQLRLSLNNGGHSIGLAHVDGVINAPQAERVYNLHIGGSVGQLQDLNAFFPHANLPDGQNLSVDLSVAGSGDAPQVQSLHVRTGRVDLGRWLPQATLVRAVVDGPTPAAPLSLHVEGQLGNQPVGLNGSVGALAQLVQMQDQTPVPVDLALTQGQSSMQVKGALSAARSALDVQGTLGHLAFGAQWPDVTGLTVSGHVESDKTAFLYKNHTVAGVMHNLVLAADMQVQAVSWQGVTWSQVQTHVALAKARLALDPIHAVGNGQQQVARFVYDLSGPQAQVEASARSVFLPLAVVQAWMQVAPDMQGTVQLVGALSAQGDAAVARRSSLAGHLGASVVDGSVGGALVRRLLGPQVPVKGQMPVRCFGVHAQFANGVARIDQVGLGSPFLNLRGQGTVTLETHELNMQLVPRVLLGGASASSFLHVTGPWNGPQVSMAPAQDGRVGITIGGGGDEAPSCAALLAAAREGADGPSPTMVTKKASREEKIMNMLHGLGLFR